MLQSLFNVQSLTPVDNHVLVVGDIWIDHLLLATAEPAHCEYLQHSSAAGLALGLAGAELATTLVGFVGDDPLAAAIETVLLDARVASDLMHIKAWPTFTSAHLEIADARDAKLDAQGRRMRRHQDERALPIDGMSEYESHLQNRVERYLSNAGALVLVDHGLGSIADPRALAYVAKQQGVPSVAVLGALASDERYGDADQRLDLTQRDFAAGVSALQAALPPSVAGRR